MNEQRIEHRMMQGLLVALGLAAIGIGFMVFVLGEQAVNLVAGIFDSIRGQASTGGEIISPTIDSELRFYATFWFSYGVLLVWVARAIDQRLEFVPILAGLFFAGGIGRVLSYVLVGAPHPIFTLLMIIELGLPILLAGLYLRVKRQ
jgi:hypothetical protein